MSERNKEQAEGRASRLADDVLERLRPQIINAIESKSAKGVMFNDIEGNSAAVGDLLTRELTGVILEEHVALEEPELEKLKSDFLAEKALHENHKEFRYKWIRGVERTLKTIRGPLRYARD